VAGEEDHVREVRAFGLHLKLCTPTDRPVKKSGSVAKNGRFVVKTDGLPLSPSSPAGLLPPSPPGFENGLSPPSP
jgi:hypothetical protein